MNCFDEVQCEETPEAQIYFDMEEMAFQQKWEEEQDRKRETQQELDYEADLVSAEIDF